MMKKFVAIAAGVLVLSCEPQSAAGQYTARLPSTCTPDGTRCTQATPVTNPDGTLIGAGSSTSGNTADVTNSGTLNLATLNATYVVPLSGGRGIVGFRISGLTGSGATIVSEGSNDGGTTWTAANTTESSPTSSLSSTLTVDGQPRVSAAGRTMLRLRVSVAGTGTASIASDATSAVGLVGLISSLPTGANFIGYVGQPDVLTTGTLAAGTVNSTVGIPLANGQGTLGINLAGLTAAAANGAVVVVETQDNPAAPWTTLTALGAGGVVNPTLTADGGYKVNASAHYAIRLRVSVAASSASNVTVYAIASTTNGVTAINAALPTGTNTIGTVNLGTLNGASTAANQTTQITAEQAIQANQTNGSQVVQGAVARAATVGANPLLMGGVYANSPTSVTADNQAAYLYTNPIGALMIAGNTGSGPGFDNAANVVCVMARGDQTTSNGCRGLATLAGYLNPLTNAQITGRGDTYGAYVSPQPSPTASAGIAPTSTQGATANTVKASAGNLYSVNVVNSTVAGFLVVYNATAAPASGTAISAALGLYCMPVAASVGFRDSFLTPIYASVGVTLLMSTSCTTYTPIGTAPVTLTGQAK